MARTLSWECVSGFQPLRSSWVGLDLGRVPQAMVGSHRWRCKREAEREEGQRSEVGGRKWPDGMGASVGWKLLKQLGEVRMQTTSMNRGGNEIRGEEEDGGQRDKWQMADGR